MSNYELHVLLACLCLQYMRFLALNNRLLSLTSQPIQQNPARDVT
jgi:hypothetical protein